MRQRVRWTIAIALSSVLPGCKLVPPPATGPAPGPVGEAGAPAATPAAPAPQPARLPRPALAPPPAPSTQTGRPIVAITALPPLPAPPAEALAAAVAARLASVRAWLSATGRQAVIVADPAGYAWLTAGVDNRVAADGPPVALAILPDRALVVAPSDLIDAARTSLRGLGFQGLRFRWDAGRDAAGVVQAVRAVVGSGALAADTHRPGCEFVGEDLLALRLTLNAVERARLSWLAGELGQAVGSVLETIQPDWTETDLATRLREALAPHHVTVVDLRVTALDRLAADGLTAPGAALLASGAAVHVTVARWGLQATVGRTVTPQPRPEAHEAMVTARAIYAPLVAAAQPGALLREVHAAAAHAAAAAGAAGLFRRLSPGGVGAYEVAARPFGAQATERLAAQQAVTVTVRLPRAYLADTLLLGPTDTRVLTLTPAWPAPGRPVNGRLVPVPTLRGAETEVAAAEQARAAARARTAAVDFLRGLVTGAVTDAAAASRRPTPPPRPVPPEPLVEDEDEDDQPARPAAGAKPQAAPGPGGEPLAEPPATR